MPRHPDMNPPDRRLVAIVNVERNADQAGISHEDGEPEPYRLLGHEVEPSQKEDDHQGRRSHQVSKDAGIQLQRPSLTSDVEPVARLFDRPRDEIRHRDLSQVLIDESATYSDTSLAGAARTRLRPADFA